jgi:GTP cyclohydrolase III
MLRQSTGYIEEVEATAETGNHHYVEGEIMAPVNKFAQKVAKVMREFKQGDLKAGAGKAPKVKSSKQAVAIALSEAKKANKLK